jgi:membrane associated rhomboid family serine protease
VLPIRDNLPTRTPSFVNYALIAANVVVFGWKLAQLQNGVSEAALTYHWGLVPARVALDPAAAVITTFTSMFMHGGFAHIGGNMLFLYIFGDNVEDALGHVRYLAFYLVGGVWAATAQVVVDPSSTMPMVGASGAISAVLAAYGLLYPRSPVLVVNPVLPLWFFFGLFLQFPAWLVIGEYFVVNLWDALTNSQQGGVAFSAHVGGFIAGAVLLRPFMRGRQRPSHYDQWERWAARRASRQRDDDRW